MQACAPYSKGHKTLIFSQMTRVLDLIEHYFQEKGSKVCRLDGSVQWQERKKQIEIFSTDPTYDVFLLSTRAGGATQQTGVLWSFSPYSCSTFGHFRLTTWWMIPGAPAWGT